MLSKTCKAGLQLSRHQGPSILSTASRSTPCLRFVTTMAQTDLRLAGNSGRKHRMIKPIKPHRRSYADIWIAADLDNEDEMHIIKLPKDNHSAPDYPHFQHEAEMQKLFHSSPFIREMTDWIPPSSLLPKPAMVLQLFERTLWDARWRRPLTVYEIKWIMKTVILGIWTIHREGLVHTD